MAFLTPHFEYDVFVSYSHGKGPNDSDSPLMRWTHALIRELELEIHAVGTEFDTLHVWRDEQIDPTIYLTDELRAKVKSSGILMIVMSPRYLASRWCKDEIEWFRQEVADRTRDQGRVFVIRALPTDEGDWPEFLRDDRGYALVGFRFHEPGEASRPFGWREANVTSEAYVRQLCLLQTALTRRLRELRTDAENRTRAPARRGAVAAGPRRIYLHARAEHSPICEDIRRILSAGGVVPLTAISDPSRDMADWTGESRARVETARRCEALALVRADGDEGFIGDLLEIGVDERERVQSARGFPLPCAVLDRSGLVLPINVSAFGIERFDLSQDNWPGMFRSWLDSTQANSISEP